MPFGNLGFEDAGASRGLADLWTLSESSDERVATYGDGGQPAIPEPPFETFRGGWLTNEDSLFAFVGAGTDLEGAVYNTGPGLSPSSVETFEEGWGDSDFEFTSANNASYDGRAFVESGNPAPYALADTDTLSVTTSTGTASSNPVSGSQAVASGAAGTFPTGFVGSNAFRITVDDSPAAVIDMGALQNLADIIGQINAVLGFDVAFDNAGQIQFQSPTTGNVSRILLEEVQAARAIATNPAPYNITDGTTLEVEADGGATQTVTFNSADFADISAATASEVAEVLNAQLTGAEATDRFGLVELFSSTVNANSRIEVPGGTAETVFDFPAVSQAPLRRIGIIAGDTLGSGNVRDLAAVTAQEIADLINGSTSLQAIQAEARVDGDIVRIYDAIPETGTVAINASPIATALAASPSSAAATGNASDTAEDFEEEWADNEAYLREQGTISAAIFDATVPEATEDFEEEWKTNETYVDSDPGGGFFVAPQYDPDPLTGVEFLEDFDPARFDLEFTVNPTTNVFTAPSHQLIDNIVTVTLRSEGGQLPSPLREDTTYFPIVLSSSTFQLKETTGGSAIDIDDAGTGDLFMKYSKSAFWTEDLGI